MNPGLPTGALTHCCGSLSRCGRLVALVPLMAAIVLAATACANLPEPPGATPTPTVSPIPFHALYVAATTLDALDPASGTHIWTQAPPGTAVGTPAVTEGVVALSASLPSAQLPAGRIDAFTARTGSPLWQRDLGANTQGAVSAAGAEFVLVTSAVSIEAPGAPAGLSVTALRPSDGSALWHQSLADTELPAPILYSQGTIFLVSARFGGSDLSYTLTALDAATGTQRWQLALGAGTVTGSAGGDGAVYVSWFPGHLAGETSPSHPRFGVNALAAGTSVTSDTVGRSPGDGTLIAYRSADGARLWQVSGFLTVQAETGGTVFATTGQQQPSGMVNFTVTAYRAASGERLWASGVLGVGDAYESKPAACADSHAAYVFNMPESQPSVHALDGASGRSLWATPLAAYAAARVAGQNKVFVGAVATDPTTHTTTTSIVALDAASGSVAWTYPLGQALGISLALL